MSQIMLYKAKEESLELLIDLQNLFSNMPEINQAFICKASLLENGKISEKTVIAVEVNGSKEISADIEDFICLKNKHNEDLIFVNTNEQPFNKYFRSEKPFYKR